MLAAAGRTKKPRAPIRRAGGGVGGMRRWISAVVQVRGSAARRGFRANPCRAAAGGTAAVGAAGAFACAGGVGAGAWVGSCS